MGLIRYYTAAAKYGWRMAGKEYRPLFFGLAAAHIVLLPIFLCFPSYRQQVREFDK